MAYQINEIIDKKRLNQPLSTKEISYIVNSYIKGTVTDGQMGAFLMAICINGMTNEEVFTLTDIMLHSGDVLDFSKVEGIFVDKHSSGGVSDSTTMIIAPIIACTGLKMLKMSGRSLGHSGGTIDKISSFEGYKVEIPIKTAKDLVQKNGACLIAQTVKLAPADKHIYKLRDETSTVQSIPLMASSIMSKKLACGSDIIVLDVKCGNGAFMNSLSNAVDLAELMVKIGQNAQKKIIAIVTDMNEPLGETIGDNLEAKEVIDILEGNKKGKLYDLSIYLAAQIVSLGKNISFEIAKEEVVEIIESGKALNSFKNMISAQGGSLALFNKQEYNEKYILSDKRGYVESYNTKRLGELARIVCEEGGKGIICHKKVGDVVSEGDKLFSFVDHEIIEEIKKCIEISVSPVDKKDLILAVLD